MTTTTLSEEIEKLAYELTTLKQKAVPEGDAAIRELLAIGQVITQLATKALATLNAEEIQLFGQAVERMRLHLAAINQNDNAAFKINDYGHMSPGMINLNLLGIIGLKLPKPFATQLLGYSLIALVASPFLVINQAVPKENFIFALPVATFTAGRGIKSGDARNIMALMLSTAQGILPGENPLGPQWKSSTDAMIYYRDALTDLLGGSEEIEEDDEEGEEGEESEEGEVNPQS